MLFRPDTCQHRAGTTAADKQSCVIEFDADPNPPANDTRWIVGTVTKVTPCPRHAHLAGNMVALVAALQAENQRKNFLFGDLAAAFPTIIDPGTWEGMGGRTISWNYDPVTRVLTVTTTGFTGAQRNNFQSRADARWPGQVVIV